MPANHDVSLVFIELGTVVVGLALLARIASRFGFSAIPLYLLAGLALGNGGLFPLNLSKGFIELGAEIGVLLLLFMLGLEYTGEELKDNLSREFSAGILSTRVHRRTSAEVEATSCGLLGGVTYISSSGVIAKVLAELRRLDYPETPVVLAVLVLEDLAMAVYLPLVAALLVSSGVTRMALSVSLALATVLPVLFVAIRYGRSLSRFVSHEFDEVILLTTFGTVLLVAGVAQRLQVSAAIGAFLVGIALSGPLAEQSHRLLAPFRDLFAATFFFFFGLRIDPATLPPVLLFAVLLGSVTALTKVLTGYWAGRGAGVERRGALRAGMALVARGEFSIVIAGLGGALEPQLQPLSAAYVLLLAILGPILARLVS